MVRRLKAGGGILLGKLATWEFAIGGPSLDLPWPPARNPWDPDRLPGGSSSGAGAAVAAGFVPGAIGTDTGGSIRGPAAFCGIAGLKPTYGRVSRRGVFPNTFSMDHCGPMTRSAEDIALMLAGDRRLRSRGPGQRGLPVPDYRAALDGGVKGCASASSRIGTTAPARIPISRRRSPRRSRCCEGSARSSSRSSCRACATTPTARRRSRASSSTRSTSATCPTTSRTCRPRPPTTFARSSSAPEFDLPEELMQQFIAAWPQYEQMVRRIPRGWDYATNPPIVSTPLG